MSQRMVFRYEPYNGPFRQRKLFWEHMPPRETDFGKSGRLAPKTHKNDPVTSVAAAVALQPRLSRLHKQVMAALKAHGPMIDTELEELPQFRGYGPSTLRKRRSELFQAGYLRRVAVRRNSRGQKMIAWGIQPPL